MKRVAFALCGLLLMTSSIPAEPPSRLAPLQWLIGDWVGVGQGEPGTSATERHVEAFIEGRYLRVSGRSVYPKQDSNPNGEIHLQMDVWSHDRSRDVLVLRQFDNLGFVSTYVLDKAASSSERLVFVAEHLETFPLAGARGTRTRSSRRTSITRCSNSTPTARDSNRTSQTDSCGLKQAGREIEREASDASTPRSDFRVGLAS